MRNDTPRVAAITLVARLRANASQCLGDFDTPAYLRHRLSVRTVFF